MSRVKQGAPHHKRVSKQGCICGQPDDGRFMIECEDCKVWHHGVCVGISRMAGFRWSEASWSCPRCIDNLKKQVKMCEVKILGLERDYREVLKANLKYAERKVQLLQEAKNAAQQKGQDMSDEIINLQEGMVSFVNGTMHDHNTPPAPVASVLPDKPHFLQLQGAASAVQQKGQDMCDDFSNLQEDMVPFVNGTMHYHNTPPAPVASVLPDKPHFLQLQGATSAAQQKGHDMSDDIINLQEGMVSPVDGTVHDHNTPPASVASLLPDRPHFLIKSLTNGNNRDYLKIKTHGLGLKRLSLGSKSGEIAKEKIPAKKKGRLSLSQPLPLHAQFDNDEDEDDFQPKSVLRWKVKRTN